MKIKIITLILGLVLITGCASLDPLGSPAKDAETGEPDYETSAGVICRKLFGNFDASGYVDGHGSGFRCLNVGEGDVKGCVKYNDGQFSYASTECSKE